MDKDVMHEKHFPHEIIYSVKKVAICVQVDCHWQWYNYQCSTLMNDASMAGFVHIYPVPGKPITHKSILFQTKRLQSELP